MALCCIRMAFLLFLRLYSTEIFKNLTLTEWEQTIPETDKEKSAGQKNVL